MGRTWIVTDGQLDQAATALPKSSTCSLYMQSDCCVRSQLLAHPKASTLSHGLNQIGFTEGQINELIAKQE